MSDPAYEQRFNDWLAYANSVHTAYALPSKWAGRDRQAYVLLSIGLSRQMLSMLNRTAKAYNIVHNPAEPWTLESGFAEVVGETHLDLIPSLGISQPDVQAISDMYKDYSVPGIDALYQAIYAVIGEVGVSYVDPNTYACAIEQEVMTERNNALVAALQEIVGEEYTGLPNGGDTRNVAFVAMADEYSRLLNSVAVALEYINADDVVWDDSGFRQNMIAQLAGPEFAQFVVSGPVVGHAAALIFAQAYANTMLPIIEALVYRLNQERARNSLEKHLNGQFPAFSPAGRSEAFSRVSVDVNPQSDRLRATFWVPIEEHLWLPGQVTPPYANIGGLPWAQYAATVPAQWGSFDCEVQAQRLDV